jgi:splicing factor 3B subunit 3
MSGATDNKAELAAPAAAADQADIAEEEKKEEVVPVTAVAMKLLDMRLKPSGAILASCIGEYTREKAQEVVIAKSSGVLELYEIHASEDAAVSLKLIQRLETHSILRGLVNVRLTGEKRDLICLSSDAGALSIVDFTQTSLPNVVTFGKTGCRRATPGQYLCADPKGRAVMVSAVEKRKLVYVLNHATGTTTIASPLEAHRSRSITYATCGVDNGYENPIFACLELQYPEEDADTHNQNKQLAYYELDLGLNHVSRKWATNVHSTGCCMAALPGGQDGPGGIIVGMEDGVSYHHPNLKQPLICGIPRRALDSKSRGILVTQLTVHRQKKSKFFCLAQSEVGDVYKLTLNVTDAKTVTGMQMALLDTLPTANALNISKKGMLFVASEFGDHGLYQFERIELPDAPTNTSEQTATTSMDQWNTSVAVTTAKTFTPTTLKNLRKVYSLDNPTPTTGVLVGELAGNEVSPQIYTLAGRGPTASLRILRHGASVTELAVSELPGIPGNIFTIPHDEGEEEAGLSKYIVVSFADATLVLSVGDTVEEVGQESRFKTDAPTLACSSLRGNGGLCQIYPDGLRQIKAGQLRNWECPGLKRVEFSSANASQALLALAGGEVIYFELDSLSGDLNEMFTKDMGADVCCLDVGTISSGKSRSLFAAVGCRDQTVKIVSLEPGKFLTQKSSTALKSRPHSVKLQYPDNEQDDIVLMIGLDDGSSLRATVDPVTGAIGASPTRRFLGARPVSVSRIPLEGRSAMLLLSSRPWISRLDPASGKHIMAPLSYAPLDHGCVFSSQAVKEGVVATAGKTLRIISVDTAGMEGGEDEAFNTNRVPLRYTPRQMTLLSTSSTDQAQQRKVVLAVVESDYNDYGHEAKKSMGFDATGGEGSKKKDSKKGDDDAMDVESDDEDAAEKTKKEQESDEESDDEDEKAARATPIRGPLPPEPGHWGSCIRLLDPSDACRTLDCIEMNRNEAALCCTSVRFHTRGGESLLAVGTVTGMTMHPLKQTSSHVILYRVVNGDRLQLLHRTTIDDGPVMALAHFQGRLLVGIGTMLRLYEMGKRQLLRKCELRGLPTFVKTLQTAGDRAYFGDMIRSLHMIRYEPSANRLVLVASDPSPRPIVSQELLDWNTVAIGDKFGNICILRLPRGADTATIDLTGQRALWDSSRDNATPKLEVLCQYYVGEIVTSMTRSSLVAGGAESLIYVTATGRIGALVPFTSRDDVEFFSQLEGYLRADAPRPTGRDPQAYRSYYAPVMHVVDGDLCSAFNSLSHEKQTEIAERLDRTVGEIMKKLEDTRNALL